MQKKSIKKYKIALNTTILGLIENRKEIDSIKNEKKEIGSRASIEAQIEKLTSQKDILSTDPNLSKEELNSYDETITNIDIVNEQILSLQKDLTNIQNIEAVVEKITFSFSLSDHIQELLNRATDDAIIAANTIWIQSKQAIIGNISKGLDKKKRRKDELLEIQDSLKSKVQKNKIIKIGKKQYYFNGSGKMVHNRTFKLYGKKYHSDKNGVVKIVKKKAKK